MTERTIRSRMLKGVKMLSSVIEKDGEDFPHNPAERGYVVAYRRETVNFCPGCGRSHWYIGRLLAECGFCTTALPLSESMFRLQLAH